MIDLENNMQNFNKVKDAVVRRLVDEGYISEDDAEEFCERVQVLVYKGTWFDKWFKKEKDTCDPQGYYFHLIEMNDKESDIDRLIRRTTN